MRSGLRVCWRSHHQYKNDRYEPEGNRLILSFNSFRMPDRNDEQHFRFFNKTINHFIERVKKVSLPGFEKIPLYDVILFFLNGFQKGALVTRASAIAFNLIIAILPSTIFLFTLIPFIPIPNFQTEVLLLFENILQFFHKAFRGFLHSDEIPLLPP